jgi:oligosaccharide repeat unit polymerase
MLDKAAEQNRDIRFIVFAVDLLLISSLLLAALTYLNPMFSFDDAALIRITSVCLLVVTAWSLLSWRILTGNWFDPYTLFLIAATLFNGGQAILEIFGLNTGGTLQGGYYGGIYGSGILEGRFSSATILKTLFLVTLGLAAYHIGGSLSVASTRKKSRPGSDITTEVSTEQSLRGLRWVGWGLLTISAVPTILVVRSDLSVVLSSGYFASFQQPTAHAFGAIPYILAQCVFPGSLFLLAGSRKYRWTIALTVLIVLSYAAAVFLTGNRQDAAMLLLAYAWVYHRCIHPIPKALLLSAGTLLLFVVFPLVGSVRSIWAYENLSFDTLFAVLADTFLSIDNPVTAIISEMGRSMDSVAYTITRVPSYRDFDMGESYFYALLSLFPSLLWDVHPSFAHGTLDDWLIATVDPARANLGNSIGYSFIAEAYINFGWLGAPLAICAIGFLVGKLVLWAGRSADPASVAMVGSFTAFFLIYARGESDEVIRAIVWYSFIPYFCVVGLRSLMWPQSSKTRDHP